ncbi:MAG: SDR family oxidoreductase, partial [Myxococcota bacterium]
MSNDSTDGRALTGRRAVVTGAGRGIGRAITHRLVELGARVAIVDRDGDAARDAADELGESCVAVPADVADESAVAAAVAASVAAMGGIDIAVNNAAIAGGHSGPITALDMAAWRRVLDVNLTGAMLIAKHCVPVMPEQGGAMVNIASTRALQSEPNWEAYAASKGGLVALTHALSVSLGPRIRVNCISPGWIATSPWEVREHRRPPDLDPG